MAGPGAITLMEPGGAFVQNDAPRLTTRVTQTALGGRRRKSMFLLILLIAIFALALGGGGWGHSHYGPWSWSPAGIVLVVGVILLLTGHVRFG
jgi:fatty acid desaturase